MEHTCNPRIWETWQGNHRYKGNLNYMSDKQREKKKKILTDILLLISGTRNWIQGGAKTRHMLTIRALPFTLLSIYLKYKSIGLGILLSCSLVCIKL